MPSRSVALVPFRSTATGKTRLATSVGRDDRAALVTAMLTDVVMALTASGRCEVVVAAGGRSAARAAAALGVSVVEDPILTVSLDHALRAAATRTGQVEALLVVAADLPQLTPRDVHQVLDAPADIVIAPTHDGGTGGLLRRPPDVIPTAYGGRSAQRHRMLGLESGVEVTCVDAAGFRYDVDTSDDLVALAAEARDGRAVGEATARLLPGLLERNPAILRAHAPIHEEVAMPQGTVKTYDPATSTGTLVDDRLEERHFDREAFIASGLQELRIGQRVRYQLEGDEDNPRVSQLNIVSL